MLCGPPTRKREARDGGRSNGDGAGREGARFFASRDGRPVLCAEGRRRREGDGDRLHLQPLPLCEGGDRPARRRRACAHGRKRRLRRHLIERRRELSRGFVPKDAGVRAGRTISRFPICTTRRRTSRAPMAPSARPTSSASTGTSSSDIAAGSTRAARPRRRRTPAASSSKPCAPSPPAARRPQTRSRRSAARSSGGGAGVTAHGTWTERRSSQQGIASNGAGRGWPGQARPRRRRG